VGVLPTNTAGHHRHLKVASTLTQVKANLADMATFAIMMGQFQTSEEWRPISMEPAPFLSDLELAVVDYDGPHALVFPCRRVSAGWVKSETREPVDVRPTHWRHWQP